MDSKQIRLNRLNKLIELEGGRKSAVANRVGTAPSYLSQITSNKGKREIGDDLARRLEEAYGKPHGWMDIPPAGVAESSAEYNENSITIPHLSTRASMGTGIDVLGYDHCWLLNT